MNARPNVTNDDGDPGAKAHPTGRPRGSLFGHPFVNCFFCLIRSVKAAPFSTILGCSICSPGAGLGKGRVNIRGDLASGASLTRDALNVNTLCHFGGRVHIRTCCRFGFGRGDSFMGKCRGSERSSMFALHLRCGFWCGHGVYFAHLRRSYVCFTCEGLVRGEMVEGAVIVTTMTTYVFMSGIFTREVGKDSAYLPLDRARTRGFVGGGGSTGVAIANNNSNINVSTLVRKAASVTVSSHGVGFSRGIGLRRTGGDAGRIIVTCSTLTMIMRPSGGISGLAHRRLRNVFAKGVGG